METMTINKNELKETVKESLAEILSKREDLLDIVEDIALGKAIEDGLKSGSVNEQEIFKTLDA